MGRGASRTLSRRLGICAATALLAVGAATAANAQDDPTDPDTELTPKPRELTKWSLVGGAKYRGDGNPVNDGSPTDHTVDFFTTTFSQTYADEEGNQTGFFGGAECMDDVEFDDEALRSCKRRPSIYRFWIDEIGDEHIEKVPTDELVDDSDKEGFIGAITWIDGNRAIAVGGTRAYPRREPSTPSAEEVSPGESADAAYLRKDKEKGAGHARAWLYEDPDGEGEEGPRWREITDRLPKDKNEAGDEEPMGALTAISCTSSDLAGAGPKKGSCLAGGMQRMWWWRPKSEATPEGFDPNPETNREVIAASTGSTLLGVSVSTNPNKTPDFHHRVRQIHFAGQSTVLAVTTGCCAERLQRADGPDGLPKDASLALGARLLTYSTNRNPPSWTSRHFSEQLRGEDAGAAGAPIADSAYGFLDPTGTNSSAVMSPGGRPEPGAEEPGARIVSNTGTLGVSTDGTSDLDGRGTPHPALDSVRLMAGAGDFASAKGPATDAVLGPLGPSTGADGVLDWAVGSLKEGSADGTAQGITYTTTDPVAVVPAPYSCSLATFVQQEGGSCEPVPENITDADLRSKRLIGMGTYALNAITFIQSSSGWAVGDRGAIARLGSGGGLGSVAEPNPPHLKPGKSRPLADRAPFEAARPEVKDPGAVPPLASRPLEALPRRAMDPYGSADPSRPGTNVLPAERIGAIAMSRDGSEGWAVGPGYLAGTHSGLPSQGWTFALQHFDGERWVRCSTDGLGGAHPVDRACGSLDDLYRAETQPPLLTTIARIPLEKDENPLNDDEFEAIAIGSRPVPSEGRTSTVLIYRDGVWREDAEASRTITVGGSGLNEATIGFTRPDDGWLAVNNGGGSRNGLYHYGGGEWPNGRWVECFPDSSTQPPAECGGTSLRVWFDAFNQGIGLAGRAEVQVAGDVAFVAGHRLSGGADGGGNSGGYYPFVYSKAPDQPWRAEYDPGCARETPAAGGGVRCQPEADANPAGAVTADNLRGIVYSFSATDLGNGRIAAWLVGRFGIRHGTFDGNSGESDDFDRAVAGPKHTLMRRDPDAPAGSQEAWSHRQVNDAAEDFLPYDTRPWEPPKLLSFRGREGEERAFLIPTHGRASERWYPPLEYNAKKDRWVVASAPFSSTVDLWGSRESATAGQIFAAAPDGQGDMWVAAQSVNSAPDGSPLEPHDPTLFYRYGAQQRRAVFADSPSPVSEVVADLDGAKDGTIWVATESDRLYRYDRVAGWERVPIPEWDPGRVITKRSKAFAVAVNDSGIGIAVGEAGRIANISPEAVTLDAATVNRCSERPPPCGTPRDLRAAEVAPDGSAMAGGGSLTLTWRPAGGDFRLIDAPRSNAGATITDISMPDAGHAWATLDNGEIWAGVLVDPTGPRPWRWLRESAASAAVDERGFARLFAVEVDSDGRGLAVGARGAMLERQADGSWKRLSKGFLDHLYSVELPPQGYGDGTLVGGALGAILTRADGRFHVARPADRYNPLTTAYSGTRSARIVGLAIAGGRQDGDTEAWAASQVDPYLNRRTPAPHALLHFASGGDPLLHPEMRARPLADAPGERSGELSVAAFGRSECQDDGCPPFAGSNLLNEVINRRISDEVIERAKESSSPVTAVSTGDLNEAPGRENEGKSTRQGGVGVGMNVHTVNEPNVAHHQWRQFVADPLLESGVPVIATPGEMDLSRARRTQQSQGYQDTRSLFPGGALTQWREAFVDMPAPWGNEERFASDSYEYRPVPGGPAAVEHPPDQKVEDPTTPVPDQTVDPTKDLEDPTVSPPHPGDQQVGTTTVADPTKHAGDQTVALPRTGEQKAPPRTGDQSIHTEGARTHYALDVIRKSDGKVMSRIVVADTSNLRSLAASDANQNPVEPQQAWLEQVLCFEGSPADTAASDCSRPNGLPAVVVTTTPTYSYGAGAVEQTQAEAANFEALMLRHEVTALITGHMGWNGLYYTFAPSLHYPQPGGAHPDSTNPPTGPGDQRAPEPGPLPVDVPDESELTGGTPVTGRVFPTVIASSAGGKFGPRGDDSGSASQGYWHGYSLVRIPADGDPRKVIVEQRPILDWINITAKSHVLRPRQRLELEGIGREPLGIDSVVRTNEIDSHAITHRYDLFLADPDKPWLPLKAEDAEEEQLQAAGPGDCGPYLCMPSSVGTIDRQTGNVRAGAGDQERTLGLAVLSVGDQTATWPISFEPRPSFSSPRVPPPPPPPPPAPPAPPANPPLGTVGNLSLPTPPALPSMPLGAELVPPAPPIPPPPPGAASAAPLNLFLAVPGINIAPQSTVIPPPAPPIQPAPPGGARKEARQRQAAAQKSGSEVARDESADGAGDLAQTPNETGTAMTRHESNMRRAERVAPGQSFTPLTHRSQPSAWATGLQWGGGMTLMALVLAFGWTTLRPGPRRRLPEVPAPAEARGYRRR